MFPERLTRLVARDPTAGDNKKLVCKENFWWEGFQIIPPRPKLGLLTSFVNRGEKSESPPPSREETSEEDEETTSTSSSADSSSVASAESCQPHSPPPPKVR